MNELSIRQMKISAAKDEIRCCNELNQFYGLNLKDENACMYVKAVVPQLAMWTGNNVCNCNLNNVFL